MYKSGYYPSSDARKCLFTYRQRGLLPTKVSGSLLCRPVGILSNQVGGGEGGGQITGRRNLSPLIRIGLTLFQQDFVM